MIWRLLPGLPRLLAVHPPTVIDWQPLIPAFPRVAAFGSIAWPETNVILTLWN